MIRNFKVGILNLIKWFPIIWNDRDWDYNYLLILLKFKLENMSYRLYTDDISTVCRKNSKKIDKAVKILSRMIEDEYDSNHLKDHDKKWGKLKMTVSPDTFQLNFNRPNVKTQDEKEKEHKEYIGLMKKSERARKRDYKNFFQLLETNIRGWWS